MMSLLENPKTKIIALGILVFLLLTLFFMWVTLKRNNLLPPNGAKNSIPSPTSIPEEGQINPSYKKNGLIPTYPPEKGSGVDLETPLVKNSMREIAKLAPFLPYEQTLQTPSRKEVTIAIAAVDSQPNTWTLQIDVFGLDYQLSSDDSEYESAKDSLRFASSAVDTWIKEMGANPDLIMKVWGDREYIRNKSQEWLE